jgi:Bacterial membrane protein YfhO
MTRMKLWTKPASALAGPAVLFLITIGVFWKLVLTNQYTWLDNPDIVNQILPWYQFQATEWHQGRFPLWDPHHWGGQSLIGQGQPGAAYPFNWILFLLPLRDGRIPFSHLNWYFVLIHYMGALFCYWLCRDLKRSRTASVIAGAAFGLSGYFNAIGWPQMLNGAVWAPLVFLFFLRAMRGESPVASAALSGAALGFSLLSGHHQIPIFISLAIGAAWIYYWIAPAMPRRKMAGLAVLFAVFVVLTSGLQVLPLYEYGKVSLRWVNAPEPVGWEDKVPYFVHRDYSLGPLSIAGVVIPGIHAGLDPFIGIVTVSLAFLGVAAAWREPMVRFFGAIAIGGLVFSLGGNAVFHGVIYSIIPMIEKARSPAQAILIFQLGVTVLAAYGLDAYRLQAPDWIWARRVVWALAGIGATLFIGILALTWALPNRGFAQDPSIRTSLAALLLAALLQAWRRDWLSLRAAGVLLTLLMCFEISAVTGSLFRDLRQPGYFVDRMEETSDIANFLRRQPPPARVELDRNLIAFNWGDWFGIDAFAGYCGVTRNVIEPYGEPAFTGLFAINYYIGPKPARDGQVEIFQGGGGLKVYRDPNLRPRVWAVHEALQISGPKAVTAALISLDFDPGRRTFLLTPAPQLETCGRPDQVRIVDRNPDRLVIEADLGCRGMVIAGETYDPGWHATVDGRPARIYEAYSALRGVVVDAGRHRVEMRYRPRSVFLGAVMTAIGIAGAIVLGVLAI